MSTNGAIVRPVGDGFAGRYHHWDSYPSGLGQTLWVLYHGFFKRDLDAMLKYLIDDHPAGWSTINGRDFNQEPGFHDNGFSSEGPECYCHGGRQEEAWELTHEDAASCGAEYVYSFNDKLQMLILGSFLSSGDKMIGAFGVGDPEATWKVMSVIDLEGEEPDWEELDEY